MNDLALAHLAARIGGRLERARLRVATAESCTAGWIAKALTDPPGSSRWFECGYVTYSNESKHRALAVPRRTLARFGAVSGQTVRAMAAGALQASGAQLAIAVSGIAGPDGATPGKPVGTVWFCLALRRGRQISFAVAQRRFRGDRDAVRRKSVAQALRLIARGIGARGRSGARERPVRRSARG
ncbi:MAG TPA: nicotinamide-nucleotide amidohydrolase family protein [Steroidobacteraceae bacterium]|nr:nicotinamide-nucleotide amidohydrolase family protein [Steroidobacteraceae bacterium]